VAAGDGGFVSRLFRPWPRSLILLGVLVMMGAGVAARQHQLFWYDPEEGCRLLGRCDTPERRAALRHLWWVLGGGFAVVVLGLTLTWRRLSPRAPAPLQPSRPAVRHVAVTGCAAAVLCLVLGPVTLVAMLVSPHAAVAAACLWWLVQARVIAEIDRSLGPGWHSERRRWVIGLLTSLVALGATALMLAGFSSQGPSVLELAPVSLGVAVAGGTALGRLGGSRALRPVPG
jgi:hypothetical protein